MRTAYADDNKSFLIKDTAKDFSTKEGTIRSGELSKDRTETNTGKPYTLFDADFMDKWKRLHRGAAIFMPKDIGAIIVHTGIGKESVIAEAGGGSGKGTTFFAHIAQHVHTFEIKPEHCKTIKKNLTFMETDNVTLYEQDVLAALPDITVDMFILDLRDTIAAMNHVVSCVKRGGYVVTYNPHITQVQAIVNDETVASTYVHLSTIEVSERAWLIKGKQSRPHFNQLVHSGFLSFFRKR